MQSQAVKWNCFSQCYCWNMLHVVAIWYPVKMRLSINLLIFGFPFLFLFKIDSVFVYRPCPDYSLLSLYSSPWVQTSPPTWTTLCFSLKNKTKKPSNNEKKHNTVRQNINQHTAFGKNKQKKKTEPKKRHRKERKSPVMMMWDKEPPKTPLGLSSVDHLWKDMQPIFRHIISPVTVHWVK